jgi:pimeloyl-ACP methyl ester carboxylesterase
MHCVVFASSSAQWQSLLYTPAPLADDGRVLLYLHGVGGFGTGIEGLFEYLDLPSLLRDGMSLSSRVLIPSCSTSGRWHAATIAAFLDDFEADAGEPGIRYDVLGYSRGGTGAYQFAHLYPDRLRTLAAMAARVPEPYMASAGRCPVCIVHGENDEWVPPANARRMHEAFKRSERHCDLMITDDDHYLLSAALLQRVFRWQRQW